MKNVTENDCARLDLSFVRRADRTVIDRRMFAWPFALTRSFHVDPFRPHCLSVIVQTASGAIHGEDSLSQRLSLGPGSAVCLTNQGATSVHRADPGARAVETVKLDVASGASLEYLPEPRILFPDAALSQTMELDCATDAHALIFDAFTMHDPLGEGHYFRELESTFRLRKSGGEPLLIDRTRICHPDRSLFRGYGAFGSAFMVLPLGHDLTDLHGTLTTARAIWSSQRITGAGGTRAPSRGLGAEVHSSSLRRRKKDLPPDVAEFVTNFRSENPSTSGWGSLIQHKITRRTRVHLFRSSPL